MDTLNQILQLILCLSILVILHELGHFLPAKWFKTRVDKFYLFFDPYFSIFKKKIGETEYGIGWLPLGGYVKIAGMIDESMDKEQLKKEPQPWEYRSKKPWQKLIIILGGVTVNFFLSWFIYTMIFCTYGKKYISINEFQKNGLEFNEAAKQAGFKDGDKIIAIDGIPRKDDFKYVIIDILLGNKIQVERNGKTETISLTDEKIKAIFNGNKSNLITPLQKEVIVDSILIGKSAYNAGILKGDKIIKIDSININSFAQFREELTKHKNQSIKLQVLRNNKNIDLTAKISDSAVLGFMNKGFDRQKLIVNNKLGLLDATNQAFDHMFLMLNYNIKQFKLIIRPKTEAYKQVSGPLRMFKMFDTSWNWEHFWDFTAMFSIWLAFLNLLPIPGLDGGHAVFILLEMITGKQASEKTMEIAQTIGFVILMSLMALVFGSDIWYWIQQAIN